MSLRNSFGRPYNMLGGRVLCATKSGDDSQSTEGLWQAHRQFGCKKPQQRGFIHFVKTQVRINVAYYVQENCGFGRRS